MFDSVKECGNLLVSGCGSQVQGRNYFSASVHASFQRFITVH